MTTPDRHRERFDGLFERHFRPVLAYARRRVDEPADAADVAAETFLLAWRRLGEIPAEPDARLWLFGAARRVLSNQRRSEARRGALADRLRAELAAGIGPDPVADGTIALVREVMRSLKDDDREILALVSWEGLDPAQAAVVMGIPAATARTRLHRARGRMRDALVRHGWEGSPVPDALSICPGSPKEVR